MGKGAFTGKLRRGPQRIFNAHQLIVFFDPLTTVRCTGFQVVSTQSNSHVDDKAIHSFTTAVEDKGTPAMAMTQLYCGDGLTQAADLIQLNQRRIGRASSIPRWI